MNTRLQVEHPVTEMVTDKDLVKLQIKVAEGERLPFTQGDLVQRGHAIECRVYAEDPDNNFLPSPGTIHALRTPGGPGIRDDSGVYEGAAVSIHYDPLVSKLVAHGADRDEALARMRRAVAEYTVLGIKTTLPFFARVLRHPVFVSGDYDTSFIEGAFRQQAETEERPWEVALAAAALAAHRERQEAVQDADSGPSAGSSAWRGSGWRDGGRFP
jgi:acetyl-CoA carboxylase, biotin carboxylase subunit